MGKEVIGHITMALNDLERMQPGWHDKVNRIMESGAWRHLLILRVFNKRSWEGSGSIQTESPIVTRTEAEDLVLSCWVILKTEENGIFSIPVTEDLLQQLKVSEDELFHLTMISSMYLFPPRLRPIDQVIRECLAEMSDNELPVEQLYKREQEPPIYVLRANAPVGAAAAFYPGMLSLTAKEMGGSFWIIPSSTAELLLVSDQLPAEALNQMVREVNAQEVRPEQQLADHVYHWDAETKTLTAVYARGEEVS